VKIINFKLGFFSDALVSVTQDALYVNSLCNSFSLAACLPVESTYWTFLKAMRLKPRRLYIFVTASDSRFVGAAPARVYGLPVQEQKQHSVLEAVIFVLSLSVILIPLQACFNTSLIVVWPTANPKCRGFQFISIFLKWKLHKLQAPKLFWITVCLFALKHVGRVADKLWDLDTCPTENRKAGKMKPTNTCCSICRLHRWTYFAVMSAWGEGGGQAIF
jgi:hypothetical protein